MSDHANFLALSSSSAAAPSSTTSQTDRFVELATGLLEFEERRSYLKRPRSFKAPDNRHSKSIKTNDSGDRNSMAMSSAENRPPDETTKIPTDSSVTAAAAEDDKMDTSKSDDPEAGDKKESSTKNLDAAKPVKEKQKQQDDDDDDDKPTSGSNNKVALQKEAKQNYDEAANKSTTDKLSAMELVRERMTRLRSIYLYGLQKVSELQDLRLAPDAVLPGNTVSESEYSSSIL